MAKMWTDLSYVNARAVRKEWSLLCYQLPPSQYPSSACLLMLAEPEVESKSLDMMRNFSEQYAQRFVRSTDRIAAARPFASEAFAASLRA